MAGPTLPDPAVRDDARRTYGLDADGYEAGRPEYPARVYELLVERCGLGQGAVVLEIGAGTGRVTSRLVAVGARVVAVEPDPVLAARLSRQVPDAVEVVATDFENARLADNSFDLAVAAMSFHWVDQAVGLPKLARVVRQGGWAALWWTLFGDPDRPDPFHEALGRFAGAPLRDRDATQEPFELDVDGWTWALTAQAHLVDVETDVIRWTARMDPEQLRALYASMILVRRLPEAQQRAFLDKLAELAIDEFGGVVERPFVTALYTARRPETAIR